MAHRGQTPLAALLFTSSHPDTSITAATITAARLEPPIQAPDDLVGQSIGVSEFFNGTLPQGVVQVRLDGDASLLEALRAGAVAAVVMPFSFILYYARTNCDLASGLGLVLPASLIHHYICCRQLQAQGAALTADQPGVHLPHCCRSSRGRRLTGLTVLWLCRPAAPTPHSWPLTTRH